MDFVRQAITAFVLMALTLGTQSAGMGTLIHWGRALFERQLGRLSPLHAAIIILRYMSVMIVVHLLQILLWAGFYRWNCFPSWESAFYFSATSYSTVGYGDLVLPQRWRTLGPVESIAGVLMCGLTASFLFAIVTRMVEREQRVQSELAVPLAERGSVPAESQV
jgi:voltage-gated potassium channel